MNPEIFREYDIRGVYGKDFDSNFAYQLAKSYLTLVRDSFPSVKNIKISVGHDARLSSPEIHRALIHGLLDGGAEVFDLGLVTSPLSYFSLFYDPSLNGNIMITGSHNPPEYNGFKISIGQSTIFGEKIQKIKQNLMDRKFSESHKKGEVSKIDILTPYVERYKKEFPQMRGIRVCLDPGNGTAGIVARRLYEACGIDTIVICEEPDGRFPNHHPDPTIESNLKLLKDEVAKKQCVVGIGFDGDADRIGVVDHKGRFILGDELLVILSRKVLAEKPGQKIIGDVKCSDRLFEDIKKHGGIPLMWKTGHSLIKEKIKTENSPLGGEMSGHIFFRDRNYGFDDALYAGLRLCEILFETKKTIPELLADLPTACNTPEIRIDTTETKKQEAVEAIKKHFENSPFPVSFLDGIRVSFPNGAWALARASNTQPVLVLRFEAQSPTELKKIEEMFYNIINPILSQP